MLPMMLMDKNYDNNDLFSEGDDEDYDLCSGCNEKHIAHLVHPCGHMVCVNCVEINNSSMWMSNIH